MAISRTKAGVRLESIPQIIPKGRTAFQVGLLEWIDHPKQAEDAWERYWGTLAKVEIELDRIENATSRDSVSKTTRPKRSTAKGDAKAKLEAAFLAHHQFENRSIGMSDPIGINELARKAEVSTSTAKTFIDKWFPGGFKVYQRDAQGNRTKLLIALTQLAGEPVAGMFDSYGADPDKRQDDD
ncbi:MAG: hypothetical protein NTY15_13735 [Planctomycetota bacterium]|nr:hypothetical protein [Planctomycetota bacterium]